MLVSVRLCVLTIAVLVGSGSASRNYLYNAVGDTVYLADTVGHASASISRASRRHEDEAESATKVMGQLRGNGPLATDSLHRFSLAKSHKSSPPLDPLDPEDQPPAHGPPRGRKDAFAPKEFNQFYTFGFLSDYYCTAKVFDEPRRMRMSCTKNPKRVMNCFCADEKENQLNVPCRCEPGMSSKTKHLNIVEKFVGV